jgi:hypothetical protein
MAGKPRKPFSRRDLWKVAGLGSIAGSQVLPAQPFQKGSGPVPPVDDLVLFPFDDHIFRIGIACRSGWSPRPTLTN